MNPLATIRTSLASLRGTLVRFRRYLVPQRGLLAFGVLAMFAEIAFRLAEPWPLKFVFDRLFTGRGSQPAQAANPVDAERLLLFAVAAVIALALLRAVAAYIHSVGFALVGNRVLSGVRFDLFNHLQHLSPRFHARARTGDLLTRVIADVGRLQDVAVTALVPLVVHSLTLLGMVGLMFVVNWQLGLLALAVFPLLYYFTVRFGRRIREASRAQRQREGEVSSIAAESLAAIRTVQALSIHDQIGAVFQRGNTANLREGVRSARLSATLERTVDVVIGVLTAAILWRGAALALDGRITPGDLIVFLTYLRAAFRPIRDMAKYAARIAKASASGERVVEILDTPIDVAEMPDARPAPERVESINLRAITFGYDPADPVIRNFDLTVQAGQRVAIVGPSGAGKSTIASLLLRLYDPDSGAILLNGVDARSLSPRSLRARFALVPQENALFRMSIRENLLLADPAADDARLRAACDLANASEFIAALPRGLDTVIGERGETLSGGQRRRLVLARAALRNAPVLVLDEPTAGLDNHSRTLVNDAILRLSSGRITFLISHDLALARLADLVIYIERGEVLERGTHQALMAEAGEGGGRYAAMYRAQAERGDAEHVGPGPDTPGAYQLELTKEAAHALPG